MQRKVTGKKPKPRCVRLREVVGRADTLSIVDTVAGVTTYYVSGASNPERTTAALQWADEAEREFRELGGVTGTKH